MRYYSIDGFDFYTDGSRLICEGDLRARQFLGGMSEESIIKLSEFIVESMPWMNTNYTDIQTSTAKEAYQPLSMPDPSAEGRKVEKYVQVRNYGIVPIYESFADDKKIQEKTISDELIQAVCIVFHACAPYLWEESLDSATDGFYTGEVEYKAYISRNYKELVSQLIGGYISSFPQLDMYTLKNFSYAFSDSHEPIEYICQLGEYFVELPSCSSDYLPFAFKDKGINLSVKRFLHWCEKYGIQRALNVLNHLVEISDNPYIPTIEANGNMGNIEQRCKNILGQLDEVASIEKEKELQDTLKHSVGKIYDLDRDPDDTYHKYAIYSLRSAVDLVGLGDTLDICVGNPRYQKGIEEKSMELYAIQDEKRQYVLQVVNGTIVQLRGYRNHNPQDEDVVKAAQYIAQEKHSVSA